jgi:L-tartrate/succinate antiporter
MSESATELERRENTGGAGQHARRLAARIAIPLLVGVALALTPVPKGLTANAWRYFALFAAVVVAVITEPVPASVVGMAGVVIACVSGLVYKSPAQATTWALSSFANGTVWLIFAAYMFALGYSKTGLGRRIALLLIRAMGRNTLGLGYAIAFADLALAPFMPSNTARSAGTIFPVVRNIPELYGSSPADGTERKIGAYLMYTALATQCVTSSMFLTGLAPNILALALVAKTLHVTVSWTMWFKGFAPAGILLFLILPLLVYQLYPPTIKRAPDVPRWASDELRNMGRISRKEITLLALVIAALAMWIGGANYIDPTIAAIIAVVLMVVFGVVSWNDIIAHRQAWDVLIYFATLLTMAAGLADTKFVDWIAHSLAASFSSLSATTATILLVGAFFFLHYLFASLTAHTSALLPVFLGVAVNIPGVSRTAVALLLCYTLGLMGILTPYATGPSPIYYGAGYVRGKYFWLLGLILGLIFFVCYVAVTLPWLSFLKV